MSEHDRQRLCGHNHLTTEMQRYMLFRRKRSIVSCDEWDCDLEIIGWATPRFNKTRDRTEYLWLWLRCLYKEYIGIPMADLVAGALPGCALVVLIGVIAVITIAIGIITAL